MTVWLTLLAAGLAGSLHCVGMCGPILLGFSRVADAAQGAPSLRSRFLAYHAGRIWTYALLGFAAGALGDRLRDGAGRIGWQRPLSIVFAAIVLGAALLLLGILPSPRLEALLGACGLGRKGGNAWLAPLVRMRGTLPRLLLGAVMGFLPCGLVYAILATVSSLPTPWHAALGMLLFGLGTIPSLSAVLLLGHAMSARIRSQGTRLVACGLLLAGGMMLWRALASPADHAAHAGAAAPARAEAVPVVPEEDR